MPSWLKVTLLAIGSLIVALVFLIVAVLMWFQIPQTGAGMAAKAVCSATFVAGRDDGQDVRAEDVLPASPAFSVITTEVDHENKTATGKFLGMFPRTAALLPLRGCVLFEDPDPAAEPYRPAAPRPGTWPEGDATVPPADWPSSVDAEKLQSAVAAGMVGAGDPDAANTRGIAVVKDGELLVAEHPDGFRFGTALHGWSMTKTVGGMLAFKKLQELGIPVETPVVDAFPADRQPDWVEQWRQDQRAQITLDDLFGMKPGLDLPEGYNPWDEVVRMLNDEPNMASWAASKPLVHDPGTYWEYSSAVSNILAQVVQYNFPSNQEYWEYPYTELFDRIGLDSATLETDTSGTWVSSSYLWADIEDWARLGQLMLQDGRWNGEQILPSEWLAYAGAPTLPTGDGAGYGAQTWIPAQPVGGECRDTEGLPGDTLMMEGHWGQTVAMIPSLDAVIVRLGWTTSHDQYDGCSFVASVVASMDE